MAIELLGRVVARYRVIELIGIGGMSTVYKAQDTRLHRLVALKFVSTALAQDPDARRQFEREARLASSLSHPNICTIYEIDTWEGQPFIAMELLSGQTLKERLARSKLDTASLADLAIQIADALGAAHGQDIIHRDVKPANIFITRAGPAKLLDFGLAKWIPGADLGGASSDGFTEAGRIFGTVNYMSPERLRGVKEVDHRTDLFSLGAVLYEAVAGCHAFAGASVVEIIDAILHREPPPLDERAARQPQALLQIIGRLLAKAPEDRYPSAAALTTALLTLREELALGRAPLAVAGRDWPPARASIAVLPFRNLDRDAENEYFGDGLASELISALDKIDGLRVAARESAFSFKRRNAELREIGTRLRVETVLDGTVRRSGNKIRVMCRLTKVADGFQVWSERYEFDKSAMGEIFDVQDEITRSIVHKLMVTRIAELRPLQRYTEDRESYFDYWRGRFYWAQRYEGGLEKAMFHFNAAITRDDRNTLAYSGKADVILFRGLYSLKRRPRDAFDEATVAAAQALELDERLPEVHTTLGLLALAKWRWRVAEVEFTRATELDKKQAPAYIYYSWLLAMRSRPREAVQAVNRAQFADPLAPLVNSGAGFTYFLMQQYDQAIEECKKCREFEPDFLVGLYVNAMALTRKGKYDEALPLISRAAELSHRAAFYVGLLGQIYAETGRHAEVKKLLEELETHAANEYVPPHAFAYIYASLGDKDQAFKWQERACEDGAPPFYFMSPAIDMLFGDPRHQDQMRRMEMAAGETDDAVRLSTDQR